MNIWNGLLSFSKAVYYSIKKSNRSNFSEILLIKVTQKVLYTMWLQIQYNDFYTAISIKNFNILHETYFLSLVLSFQCSFLERNNGTIANLSGTCVIKHAFGDQRNIWNQITAENTHSSPQTHISVYLFSCMFVCLRLYDSKMNRSHKNLISCVWIICSWFMSSEKSIFLNTLNI